MMHSQLVRTQYGVVEYTLQGQGPVILSIHGGHSNCYEEFGYAALLRAGYTILTPSRPGYRRTPAVTGRTPEAAAAAMIGLLDALDIDEAVVLAFSAGGPTGLALAANFPQRVRKLVLESAVTTTWLAPGNRLYTVAKVMFHPISQHVTWFLLRTFSTLFPRWMARVMMTQFSSLNVDEIMQKIDAESIAAIVRMNRRQHSDRGFMLDIDHRVPPEMLQRIQVPTLIVHSKYDNSVPFHHAEHAAAHIPTAELIAVETWGHLIWLGDHAAEVERQVLAFLAA